MPDKQWILVDKRSNPDCCSFWCGMFILGCIAIVFFVVVAGTCLLLA